MRELTKSQSELLYDIADKHQEWYAMHYNKPPAFDVLLELNHRKLSYKITTTMSDDDVTKMLEGMLQNYIDLINYYSK